MFASVLYRGPRARSMPGPIEILRRGLTLWTHRIHSLPVLVLAPHSRCNCRCVMCDIWRANKNRRELSEADLEPHVDALRRLRVRHVALTGGEALMHSNLWRLTRLLAPLGIRTSLLSTGLLLARHAPEIVREVDEVIVSLDGPPVIHDEIRNVPRAFDRLREGVAALREIDPAFRVQGRSVVQRRNFRALGETLEGAREIGLDALSFLAADVSSEAFNRPGGWDERRREEVALDPDEARELERRIETFIHDHGASIDSGYVVESREQLRGIARHFLDLHGLDLHGLDLHGLDLHGLGPHGGDPDSGDPDSGDPDGANPHGGDPHGGDPHGPDPRGRELHGRDLHSPGGAAPRRCNAPWVSAVVEADGSVLPCFFHPAIGHLDDGPLDQVLNSERARAFRRHLDVGSDPICRRCTCSLYLSPRADV